MKPLKGDRFEVYQQHDDSGGVKSPSYRADWRWRLVMNGRIVADSGEGYRQRARCIRMVWRIFGNHEAPLYILGVGADPRRVEFPGVK